MVSGKLPDRGPGEDADAGANADGVRSVQAQRFSTEGVAKPVAEDVSVVEEVALTIDVEGIETYTILSTPTDRQALAVGFLFTEGVIDTLGDIKVLKECDDDPNTVRVRLTGKVPRIADAGRNLLIVSSCGACGGENLRERIAALPVVGDTLRVEAEVLRTVADELSRRQVLFQACGGTHAAGVFTAEGKIVAFAEDGGRHNALDKVIGQCLIDGISTAGLGVALTSRLSLEMVSKCARAGIELITAVSAATALAIEVGERSNITLCGFVRKTRGTVFSHGRRVVGVGGE